ncbi:MAG: hypothetical protein ACI9PY_003190 [Ascidiaceihabitans sp.]|jgi:hypothetical protein
MSRYFLSALLISTAPISAAAHDNVVKISQEADMTCIASNGAPNHDMGRFPNKANPNAFRAQTLTFCFPSTPEKSPTMTTGLMTVGVSLTGVPFRPYTAGYYDANGRRGFSQDPSSGWRQQAMHDPRRLGMDDQNAHVDRSGLYHYHGVSADYLESQNGTLIGYAPDGFEIHYIPHAAKSSWILKSGTRQTPPRGAYDGTFEEDFEYKAGSGTLDKCNGGVMNGEYHYFATDTYPFFPRCFKGVVNDQFMTRR